MALSHRPYLGSLCERDMDLLLLEEFHAEPDFVRWCIKGEPSRFPETGPRIRHGRKTTQAYEAARDSASANPRTASGDPYSSLGTGSTTSRDFLTEILVS